MPTLTFDRSVPLSEQRLRVALSKCSRKVGKKHGTGARKASIARAKKMVAKAKRDRFVKELRTYKAATAAYWRGETDCHPLRS